MSTREPDRTRSACRTFSTWAVVAGTNGRQIFLRAGATNGAAPAYRATSDPPSIPVTRRPRRLLPLLPPPASLAPGPAGAESTKSSCCDMALLFMIQTWHYSNKLQPLIMLRYSSLSDSSHIITNCTECPDVLPYVYREDLCNAVRSPIGWQRLANNSSALPFCPSR